MRKSPSSSRRLVRVMSKIAEERAFRGRSPTTSKPKTITGTIVDWSDEDDDGAGGAAEFSGFDFTPEFIENGLFSPQVETPNGPQTIVIETKAKNELISGVDWAEVIPKDDLDYEANKPAPATVDKADKDLIDILFPPTRATQ